MSSASFAMPELGNDLWRLAQSDANGRGFQFSDEFAAEMQNFIRNGVATLDAKDLLDDAKQVSEAKKSISKFVDLAIRESIREAKEQDVVRNRTGSFRVVHPKIFHKVIKILCPLFPFC